MNEQFQKEINGIVDEIRPIVDEFVLDWGNDEVRVVNPQTGGAKGQKLARFDLLPWDVLWEVAEHFGRGALKYEDRNWEKGYMWSLSYAALMRHLIAFWNGEDTDPETGSHHLDAVIFHAMALRRYTVSHPEFDDRPKGF